MIKTRLLTSVATAVLAFCAQNGVAQEGQGCYAQSVIEYVPGTLKNSANPVPADRQHSDRALGVPQDNNTENFVSLGYGGSITLGFGGAVMDGPGKDLYIVETSYASNDCLSDGIERAQVYLSADGTTWAWAGEVCRDGSVDIAAAGLTYAVAIKIDNDASSTTPDGFDVDGVYAVNGCGEIPAAGCFAVSIYDYYQGVQWNGSPITDPIRIDPTKTLGTPENDRTSGADNFFSLGNGGWITLEMGDFIITDATPAADLRVYETTWGNMTCAQYPEYADIWVGVSGEGPWYQVADNVCQGSFLTFDLDAYVPGGVHVKFVKIATNSTVGNTEDYFDVDGVEALWGCEEFNPQTPGGCAAACVTPGGYVQGVKKNGGALPAARTNWEKALGTPEESDATTSPANNNFVSLGYGGSLTLCFDGYIMNDAGDDIEVIETSFGNPSCTAYPEYADVWVSNDDVNYYFVKTGCHNFAVNFDDAVDAEGNPMPLPYVQFVRIVNNDTLTTTPDAFDVDGVKLLASQCEQTQGPTAGTPNGPAPIAGFKSFPNPTRGDISFNFVTPFAGQTTLEIYNTAGQRVGIVFQGELEADQETTVKYDMSSLENGIYISKLTTPQGVSTGKVMLAK